MEKPVTNALRVSFCTQPDQTPHRWIVQFATVSGRERQNAIMSAIFKDKRENNGLAVCFDRPRSSQSKNMASCDVHPGL